MNAALALALLLAGPAHDKEIQWEKNFDKAMEKAKKQDMPVMVGFWTEWCGWCYRLDRTTYVEPVVVAKAKSFVAVKVNSEGSRREIEVAERYRVHSIPTILFVSPRGRQVWRVNSFQGPGRFPHTMDRALEAARQVSAWEDAIETDPTDAGALFALGQHLWKQDCFEDAEELLARAAAHDLSRPAQERRTTRLLLAILQNVQHRYAEAETLIKEALTLDPKGSDQPKLLYYLGSTYVRWGRREMGMQTMEVIVREHPQSPAAQKARETLVILERK